MSQSYSFSIQKDNIVLEPAANDRPFQQASIVQFSKEVGFEFLQVTLLIYRLVYIWDFQVMSKPFHACQIYAHAMGYYILITYSTYILKAKNGTSGVVNPNKNIYLFFIAKQLLNS